MNDIDLDLSANRFCKGAWKGSLLILVLAGLVLTFPEQAESTFWFVLENLLYMAPIVAIAVMASGLVRATGSDAYFNKLFEGRLHAMILAAAAFGAVAPICGIGVLPLIAGLLATGIPIAPVMAFWLASPVTSPEMFLITVGTLGWEIAVGKTVIALLIGIGGGYAMALVERAGWIDRPLRAGVNQPGGGCGGCAGFSFKWRFWQDADRRKVVWDDVKIAGPMIVKWLAIAFAVESLLRAHVPPEWIASFVGAENAMAIPTAVIVGAPIYLDGYASLPMVRGLMDLGMTPGAAMGFLVAGGIVSLYASVAVYALVRLPVFLMYIGLAVTGSLIGAYGFEAAMRLL